MKKLKVMAATCGLMIGLTGLAHGSMSSAGNTYTFTETFLSTSQVLTLTGTKQTPDNALFNFDLSNKGNQVLSRNLTATPLDDEYRFDSSKYTPSSVELFFNLLDSDANPESIKLKVQNSDGDFVLFATKSNLTGNYSTGNILGSITDLTKYFSDGCLISLATEVGAGNISITEAKLKVTATPTPIPAAAWLLGSGLLGMVGLKRRKTTAA